MTPFTPSPAPTMRRDRASGTAQAGRAFAIGLGVILVAALLSLAWVGSRVIVAQGHLERAEQIAAVVPDLLGAAPEELASAVERLSDEAADARAVTRDPLWRIASRLPWIGPQLEAVAAVVTSVDDLARIALGLYDDPAISMDLSVLLPHDGVVDTDALIALQRPAAEAAGAARVAAASIEEVDRQPLLGAIRARVDEASDLFASVGTMTRALSQASALLPPMLGADGPRDYLVLFQNNAEWRSLGGVPGAVALIHTDSGAITMTQQTTATALSDPEDPVPGLDAEARALFGERPAQWMHSVTQVPDFAVAGKLAQAYWEREYGVVVDGVLSFDPVALSYLLEATGPLTLSTGETLWGEYAVEQLTNEVYSRLPDPSDQDAFFAGVAGDVFASLTETTDSDTVVPLMEALSRAAEEDRLLVWSAREDEQATLAGTPLHGALPESDADTTRFGVYVNDATGSKMDYFMRLETSAWWCSPQSDGDATATLRVTLRNDTAVGAGAGMADYVTGGGQYGIPAGTTKTLVYVYLPPGATLLDAGSGEGGRFGGGFHRGHQVIGWSVDIAEGMAAVFEIKALVHQTVDIEVKNTPILHETETWQSDPGCS